MLKQEETRFSVDFFFFLKSSSFLKNKNRPVRRLLKIGVQMSGGTCTNLKKIPMFGPKLGV